MNKKNDSKHLTEQEKKDCNKAPSLPEKTLRDCANVLAERINLLPPSCQHPNLVPLEIKFGKKTYLSDKDVRLTQSRKAIVIDWESNVMGAHMAKVVKYYCPSCKKEIII